MENLKIIENGAETILKNGRKIYATVSFNKNPDYKWMLWIKGSIALSGFGSKESAIQRANDMAHEYKNLLSELYKKPTTH